MFKRAQTKFSTLWRIADIVCALLVVFYILFEVLDLDGSDTYRVVAQTVHSAMLAEADSEFRIDDSLELRDRRINPRLIAAHLSSQFTEPLQVTVFAFPLTVSDRSHGDRGCRPEQTTTGAAPDH
jgi:hypothetical protein